MVPDMGEISAGYSVTADPTITGAAVSVGTPCVSHPTTPAAHTTLQPMDAPITTHAMTQLAVKQHPTVTTSPIDVIYTTIP